MPHKLSEAQRRKFVFAPFTPEQVESLNGYQTVGYGHRFTCGNDACPGDRMKDEDTLVATKAGWVCPSCDYTQNWAHRFMAENGWLTGEEVRKRITVAGRAALQQSGVGEE